MAKPFYDRLNEYFDKVGAILRGEAEVASVFPNTTDIGQSRELVYAKFLSQHAPSKCNVFLGGFLFGDNGEESKQLDVIITSDTAPRYNFYNADGKGKSFGPVEGCLGIASIKSTLDKDQLIDSLNGIGSIPSTLPIGNRVNPMLEFDDYDNWPYKIIYASNGLTAETILGHLNNFYISNPQIPITRRPDIIHVAGKYVIFKIKKGMRVKNPNGTYFNLDEGMYHIFKTNPDRQAMLWIINDLQEKATITNHIIFDYSKIINNVIGL